MRCFEMRWIFLNIIDEQCLDSPKPFRIDSCLVQCEGHHNAVVQCSWICNIERRECWWSLEALEGREGQRGCYVAGTWLMWLVCSGVIFEKL